MYGEMENEFLKFADQMILSCADVEELIDARVDGELTETLNSRVQNHLDRCEHCRSLLFDIERLIALARELDSDPIPPGVKLRLRKRLAEEIGEDISGDKLSIVK